MLEFLNDKSQFSVEELTHPSLDLYPSEKSIEFEVEILEQAKYIFYKEHYQKL